MTLSSALSAKRKPSATGAAKCFPQRENLPKNAAATAKPAAAAIDRRKRRTASTVRRLFFCLFYRHFSALPPRFAAFAASAACFVSVACLTQVFVCANPKLSVSRRRRQPPDLIRTKFQQKKLSTSKVFTKYAKTISLYKTADPSTNEEITPAAPALRKQSASSSGTAILPLYSL